PIARHDPFMHAADDLDTALAAIKEHVEIPLHLAEIVVQWQRIGIERGEPQSLVIVELRYWRQAPALAVQFIVVGLLQIRHADQPPVIAVRPAMICAGEGGGVTGIGAAQPVATMAADIQKCVYLSAAVAHHQNRVFTHIGGEEIARLRNLALVAQIEPAAREDPLQLLLVDPALDKDAATDQTLFSIDQSERVGCHRPFPHWFCGVRRGTRSIAPASTVMMVPVMPLALFRELKKTYAPAISAG